MEEVEVRSSCTGIEDKLSISGIKNFVGTDKRKKLEIFYMFMNYSKPMETFKNGNDVSEFVDINNRTTKAVINLLTPISDSSYRASC